MFDFVCFFSIFFTECYNKLNIKLLCVFLKKMCVFFIFFKKMNNKN